MRTETGGFRTSIPGQYTDSIYPLQYYFVLRREGQAWRVPELADDLANQPYWVLRPRLEVMRDDA